MEHAYNGRDRCCAAVMLADGAKARPHSEHSPLLRSSMSRWSGQGAYTPEA